VLGHDGCQPALLKEQRAFTEPDVAPLRHRARLAVALGCEVSEAASGLPGTHPCPPGNSRPDREKTALSGYWATGPVGFLRSALRFAALVVWLGTPGLPEWSISAFFVIEIAATSLYEAAELSLPSEDYAISDDSELDFLTHSLRSQVTSAFPDPLGGTDTES
jgi:hypothetical protein